MRRMAGWMGLAMVFGLCGWVFADSGDYVVQVAPVTGITADGDPSDWDSYMGLLDVQSIGDYWEGDKPDSTEDLSATMVLGYEANTLYVLVTVVDSSDVADTSSWDAGDRIEFYTDFDRRRGGYNSPFGSQQWVVPTGAAARVRDAQGDLAGEHDPAGHVLLSDLGWGASGGSSRVADTTYYELALPSFRDDPRSSGDLVDLSVGRLFGVDVAICDRDSDGSFTWASWSPEGGKAWEAWRFGHGVIVSEMGGPKVSKMWVEFDDGSDRGDPGGIVEFSVEVTDPDGVSAVWAYIDSVSLLDSVGVRVDSVQLFDDGAHHDEGIGDHRYGGAWETLSEPREYRVSVWAEDGSTSAIGIWYKDLRWFSTVNVPPFVDWFHVHPDGVVLGDTVTMEAKLYDRHGVQADSVCVDIERDGQMWERRFLSFDRYADQDGRWVIFKGMWITELLGSYQVSLSARDSTGVWFWDEHHRGVNVVDVVARLPHMVTSAGDTTVRVPILVSDVSGLGIVSVEMTISYDAGVLVVPEAGFLTTGETLTQGWSVSSNTLKDPIRVRIIMGGASLSSEGVLVYLNFNLAEGVHHGAESHLNFDNFTLNDGAVSSYWKHGRVRIRSYGDVSDNGAVTPFDAALILFHSVEKINLYEPGSQEYASGQWVEVYDYTGNMADVSGEHGIRAYDGALVLRRAVGIMDPFPVEQGEMYKPVVASPRVVAFGDVREEMEGTFAVPVVLDQMEGVLSGEVQVGYDPGRWRVVEVVQGELISEALFASRIFEDRIRIAFAGTELGGGSGALVWVRFRSVLGVEGDAELTLDRVQLNEGLIPVTVGSSQVVVVPVPREYALRQNIPNPFNPFTEIGFDVAEAGEVALSIYSLSGQRIRTLVGGVRYASGRYVVVWDGKDGEGREVGSGMYLYRMVVNGFTQSRKMAVIR